MQVQKIQGMSVKNNVKFGYNPVVNAELIKTLENSKRNKAFNSYLKNIIEATNKAETDLRTAEKNNKKQLVGLLLASFVPVKVLITDMINLLFPETNYREQELASYSEEMKKMIDSEQTPPDWMCSIADTLNEHAKQDQAEYMANVLQSALQDVLPNTRLDLSGLTDAIRQEYIEGYEESDNADDAELDSSTANDLSMSLEDRIKIGKEKAPIYVPKTDIEKMGFASLGGMQELKDILTKKIITPLKDPVQAKYNEEHYGIKRPNGILFYGPPGTGKTTIVERLAVETGLPLLEITRDNFDSIYVGGPGLNLACIFDYAASIAKEEKPVILFIDDIDTILSSRDDSSARDSSNKELGIVFKRIQDAPKNNIIVMASTNNFNKIDKALSSRLRNQIYVGYLDEEGRKAFFKMKLEETDNGKKLAADDVALNKIAKITDNFSTRALEDFVTEAREKAQIDFYNVRDIELKDFEEIIAKPESQNKKDKEDNYKTKATRKSIGF